MLDGSKQLIQVMRTAADGDLNLCSFDLGGVQHLDELLVVHRVPLSGAEAEQDLVFNLFQLLLHLGVADDQLVLGLLQVWTFFSDHLSQQLVLQPTIGT